MRTEINTIKIYSYDELNEDAKLNVVNWLDSSPLEYKHWDDKLEYVYFIDMEETEIQEHCNMNGYEFLEDGTIY
jgi:hypothetical protein